ncbi:Phage tail assembly chaperone gp38 [Erwinia billingiae Eb661]|uniref:Phage tail assembly chaperone gp38 n=1 Tax=Erwinia billingiae (strain Eb661) TaxID=634500 RepID=D8MKJ6_ERWBE|nr:tail fiber assembly protein [Erwinia billingiae]CAX57652.1 Phage tail assembly chaperone gp38 [Erwinia billingiae Eb661]
MAKVTLDNDGLAKSAGTLKVYNFDAVSGEYTGTTDEYLLPGVGIPANACTSVPPSVATGQVVIFRNGSWVTEPDHRGERVYSVADGSEVMVTETGDYPSGTTTLKPSSGFDAWDGKKWVTDTDAKQAANVSEAERHKAELVSQANSFTQSWQTQLMLGIISDKDKSSLTEWMRYIQAVQEIETSLAPNIPWPVKPQ